MAKPKKTASGKWHVSVYLGRDHNGKPKYKSITADTKGECSALARAAAGGHSPAPTRPKNADLTRVCDAVDKYINQSQFLSPSTLAGYDKIRRTAFPHLMEVPVADLTDDLVQEAINIEARREGRRGPISAHTVLNEWGLISSALWHVCRRKFDVRLPKKQRHLKVYPDPAEVMAAVIGTPVELPCLLALWLSFTMSEVRGLKFSDVHNGYITINRVIVDAGTLPVEKPTAKTEARLRRHRLPPYLQDLISEADHSTEYIVPHNATYITYHFEKVCAAHDWEITFHDLRHLNASVMLALNVPDKYAMERGGWSTPDVMRSVYQHTFSAKRRAVDDLVDGFFTNILYQQKKVPKPLAIPVEVRGSNPLRSTKDDDL